MTPSWIRSLGALTATVLAMAAFVAVLGASPIDVFAAVIRGSLGSAFGVGQTVIITGILTLTALAALVPFTARLWNIGGEGQMTVGAVTAAVLGVALPQDLNPWIFVPLTVAATAVAGALWGAIPGLLKATRDASEIVTSLMLNFVAFFLATWIISDVYPEGFVNRTETISSNAELARPFEGSLIDAGVLLAIAAALAGWLLMSRTKLGFTIRSIGANAKASHLAGINIRGVTISTFVIGGGFAGLAGALVVLGRDHALLQNFSASFGFMGIAVALFAQLRPLRVLPAALAIAVLRVGSNSLQASTGLPPTIGDITVAIFIMLLILGGVIKFRYPESTLAH
jgi:simple sugar transport system permease protein